jgi:hypothetical protein
MKENGHLNRRGAAAYMLLKPETLAAWAVLGQGPKFFKAGGRALYRQSDLDAWLASRVVLPGGRPKRRGRGRKAVAT